MLSPEQVFAPPAILNGAGTVTLGDLRREVALVSQRHTLGRTGMVRKEVAEVQGRRRRAQRCNFSDADKYHGLWTAVRVVGNQQLSWFAITFGVNVPRSYKKKRSPEFRDWDSCWSA